MPNGADPHEFQPSARDVAELSGADLVVANGLGLEEGLEDALRQAEDAGTPVVEATDLVRLRRFDPSDREEIAEHGPEDPHIWTDPLTMRQLVAGLVPVLREEAGIDAAARAAALEARLTRLDAEIRATLADVPPARPDAGDRPRVDGLLRGALRLPAGRGADPLAQLAGRGVGRATSAGPPRAGAATRACPRSSTRPGRPGGSPTRSPTRPAPASWRSAPTRSRPTAPTSR